MTFFSKFCSHKGFACCLILLACLLPRVTIAQARQEKDKFVISLSPGYQGDNLQWSIAGNIQGTSPNIYSELKWSNLQSIVAGANLKWNIWKGLALCTGFSRAFIIGGKVTDNDYGADNRTDPVYYGYFNSNKGSSSSFKATAGYEFALNKKTHLTPSLGYATNNQSLYILPNNANTPASLKSTYSTSWNGAVAGLEMKVALQEKISLEPSIQYYQVKFTGKADWNLIQTFQHPLSFKDVANGFGIEPSIKLRYKFASHASVYVTGQYFYWETGKGTDNLYLSAGPTVLTQFNSAKRFGFATGAGISLSF